MTIDSDPSSGRWADVLALAALAIVWFGGGDREVAPPRVEPPLVGRTHAEILLGLGVVTGAVPWYPAVSLPAFEALSDRLGSAPWPEFARDVLFWTWTGEGRPSAAEEGVPWHVELAVSGEITSTPRYVASRPARPRELTAREAERALIVFVPQADVWTSERRTALELLVAVLDARLAPEGTFVLPSDADGPSRTSAAFPRELLQRPSRARH